ncbi:hypothetical protein [Deinococcus navajonensis]|uniref:Uncharacterized protein n=1 Tax=Deinococcus navajonensis TaxID=309884 RepID=A0ABV8XKA0_9DEIO
MTDDMMVTRTGRTLTDVLGTEGDPVYRAGQALTVLEGWQLRMPRLKVMVTGGVSPRVVGLLGTAVCSTGSAIATTSDMKHVAHLQSLMQRQPGAEPLDIAEFARNGTLYEIRPSALADVRRATWALAEAADEVVLAYSAFQNAQGPIALFKRSRLRAQVAEAQERWGRSCEALVRVSTQVPLLTVTALPVGLTKAAAVWDEQKWKAG